MESRERIIAETLASVACVRTSLRRVPLEVRFLTGLSLRPGVRVRYVGEDQHEAMRLRVKLGRSLDSAYAFAPTSMVVHPDMAVYVSEDQALYSDRSEPGRGRPLRVPGGPHAEET